LWSVERATWFPRPRTVRLELVARPRFKTATFLDLLTGARVPVAFECKPDRIVFPELQVSDSPAALLFEG
jgi:hypothetical protein